jgi:prolipoprotein diacylglyceryltransferase
MQIIILIICLLVFFFVLYRLGRDDYVLIRKNVSMEQLFDVGFLALIVGVLFARSLFVFLYPSDQENIFLKFFAPTVANLSLTGVVVGGWIWTYLVGKYKKYPLGRIFDFLCLAFLIVLPLGFLGNLIFLKKTEMLINGILGLVYLILAFIFAKLLYPRLMSAKLREGSLSTLFLLSFSLLSLGTSVVMKEQGTFLFFGPEDFFLIGVCVLSVILLLRQERKKR